MVILGIGSGVSKKGKDYITLCVGTEITNSNRFKGYSTDRIFIFPDTCTIPSDGLDLGDEVEVFYNKGGFPIQVVKAPAK